MSAALYGDPQALIQRNVANNYKYQNETKEGISTEEFDKEFEITSSAEMIINGNHQRVALQFPDELLPNSGRILRLMNEKLKKNGREEEIKVFILGDTSYGACCCDEVAAQHLGATVLIHYGLACLST
jgi:diphthamide biosynthesis protein 2